MKYSYFKHSRAGSQPKSPEAVKWMKPALGNLKCK